MTTLMVSEIFGPTIQGEGPSAGRRAWFVRLGGCNLTCSWCDTPWTWDATRHDLRAELRRMSVADVAAALPPYRTPTLLVITGGEPLLQEPAVRGLIDIAGHPTEVETNGTLSPPRWALACDWNVSPKLAHSGHASRLAPDWLHVVTARFKFVVTGPGDLDAVAEYRTPPARTWVMPEGTTAERTLDVARAVAPAVLERGWNLTLRQHVLLWGDERGR